MFISFVLICCNALKIAEFQNTKPIDEFNCIGVQCLPQPTLPAAGKL